MVFDSGLGGLTVVRRILERLGAEDVVYLGDSARVPYGIKSPETIRRFALEDMAFLLRGGVLEVEDLFSKVRVSAPCSMCAPNPQNNVYVE